MTIKIPGVTYESPNGSKMTIVKVGEDKYRVSRKTPEGGTDSSMGVSMNSEEVQKAVREGNFRLKQQPEEDTFQKNRAEIYSLLN